MQKKQLLGTVSAVCMLMLAACAAGPQVEGQWQPLGETADGNIRVAVDKASIKRNGQSVIFRDRKVVVKPAEMRYVNTPSYKTALGEWEIHCTNRTYRLTALTLLAANGQVVAEQRYSAVDLRPMPVQKGSINEKQWQTVCAGSGAGR
ncbi:surface-adhesin E family protein [Neisseria leonii]|uniref:surface-adhesin E family protein n=1 Tax=Neisseria leonii TaxID=2995413 RepID=UPI00237B3D09|nr:surface-adhesin E family protein [Neisseria sp. 3986]MDD9326492.1 hypothetical protein [Neisseria sp. 3986]